MCFKYIFYTFAIVTYSCWFIFVYHKTWKLELKPVLGQNNLIWVWVCEIHKGSFIEKENGVKSCTEK